LGLESEEFAVFGVEFARPANWVVSVDNPVETCLTRLTFALAWPKCDP
jgi:hypothetical protein